MESKLEKEARFLKRYAILATLVCGVYVLTAFTLQSRKQNFEEITANRIKIVDPAGKIRVLLATKPKVKPHGPYGRDESVLKLYRRWLWEQMQDEASPAYKELLRLKALAEEHPLRLACWCAPLRCHGEQVRAAILFLARQDTTPQ